MVSLNSISRKEECVGEENVCKREYNKIIIRPHKKKKKECKCNDISDQKKRKS